MSKAKGKGGTGRGTDKKGWNRWQAQAKRLQNAPKPYKSKGTKKRAAEAGAAASAAPANNNSKPQSNANHK